MDHFGSVYEHFKRARTKMEQAENSRIEELASKDEWISSLKNQLHTAQVSMEKLKTTLKAKNAEIEKAKVATRAAHYEKDNDTLDKMQDGFENFLSQVRKLAPDLSLGDLELDVVLLPLDPEVLPEAAATDVLLPLVNCPGTIIPLIPLVVLPPPALFTEAPEGGGES